MFMKDHKLQQEDVGATHDNKWDNRLFYIKEIRHGVDGAPTITVVQTCPYNVTQELYTYY